MTKTRRQLEKLVKLTDVIVELCDARVPEGSRNPDFDALFKNKTRVRVLNKEDLADPAINKAWVAYYAKQDIRALPFRASTGNPKVVVDAILQAAAPVVERAKKRGMNKTVRAMVVGIPNVGKSTFTNRLFGGRIAKVGNRPGVTRANQWVKVHAYLEMLDTPGMLWPKFEDKTAATHLAMIGSIRDEIMDVEELAMRLLALLRELSPQRTIDRFKLESMDMPDEELLEAVCRGRGFLMGGGRPDTLRAANIVLDEFRNGKIGRVSLERPPEEKHG